MNRRVFYLQPDRLSVFHCDRESVSVDHRWPVTGTELPSAASVYLLANKGAEFSLLTDLPEEECHLEETRTVGLRDRKHLLERTRIKCFANALLSKVTTQGNNISNTAGNASRNTVMVSGVYQHALCETLIDKIVQSESVLRSIHSAVTLTDSLSKPLGAGYGVYLLVMASGTHRFRLIACIDSFVVFSRSVECVGVELTELGSCLLRSVRETLVYLNRQSIDGWQAPRICLVGGHACIDAAAFESLLDSKLVVAVEQTQASISVESKCSESELLLLRALQGADRGYASSAHRRFYVRNKVRNASAALAISTLVAAASSAVLANKVGGQYQVLSENYKQSAAALSDPESVDQEYPVEAVRQALVTARLIKMRSAYSPVDFLKHVAGVVNESENISAISVSWQQESQLDKQSLQLIMQQPAGNVPLEQLYRATLSGEISGDHTGALAEFESFVTSLRRSSADMSVVVLDAPFGLGENNHTNGSEILDANAQFTLELSGDGVAR